MRSLSAASGTRFCDSATSRRLCSTMCLSTGTISTLTTLATLAALAAFAAASVATASVAAADFAAPVLGAAQAEEAIAQNEPAGTVSIEAFVLLGVAAGLAVSVFLRLRWFRWQSGTGPRLLVPGQMSGAVFATSLVVGWTAALLVSPPAESSTLATSVTVGATAIGAQLAWMAAAVWMGRSASANAGASVDAGASADAGAVPGSAATRLAPDALRGALALTALVNLLGWPVLLVASSVASAVESMWREEMPRLGHRTLQEMSDAGAGNAWWWGAAFVAVVMAPIAEEILNRGFLQQAIRRALRGVGHERALAIAGTSLVFALLHWGALPEGARYSGLTTLFVFSLMLGYLYERTGRLSMCIATHALFNAVNLARM